MSRVPQGLTRWEAARAEVESNEREELREPHDRDVGRPTATDPPNLLAGDSEGSSKCGIAQASIEPCLLKIPA